MIPAFDPMCARHVIEARERHREHRNPEEIVIDPVTLGSSHVMDTYARRQNTGRNRHGHRCPTLR